MPSQFSSPPYTPSAGADRAAIDSSVLASHIKHADLASLLRRYGALLGNFEDLLSGQTSAEGAETGQTLDWLAVEIECHRRRVEGAYPPESSKSSTFAKMLEEAEQTVLKFKAASGDTLCRKAAECIAQLRAEYQEFAAGHLAELRYPGLEIRECVLGVAKPDRATLESLEEINVACLVDPERSGPQKGFGRAYSKDECAAITHAPGSRSFLLSHCGTLVGYYVLMLDRDSFPQEARQELQMLAERGYPAEGAGRLEIVGITPEGRRAIAALGVKGYDLFMAAAKESAWGAGCSALFCHVREDNLAMTRHGEAGWEDTPVVTTIGRHRYPVKWLKLYPTPPSFEMSEAEAVRVAEQFLAEQEFSGRCSVHPIPCLAGLALQLRFGRQHHTVRQTEVGRDRWVYDNDREGAPRCLREQIFRIVRERKSHFR